MNVASSGSRPRQTVDGSFGFQVIRAPSVVPNAPQAGSVVTLREIIEVDLAACRTVLLSEEMTTYIVTILGMDGVGEDFGAGNPEALTQAITYRHWREVVAPQRCNEMWVMGQRVLKRAGTSTVQTLVATKRKRARRMQYQRNP